MSCEDWYRNQRWNSEIEAAFRLKLKRARRKEQYLRIQASTLSDSEPLVALSLLEEYFTLNDKFDHAQAYCDMANAYLSLGEESNAIDAFYKALQREEEFPNLKTDAYILYPITIVIAKQIQLYQNAQDVLEQNKDRLLFPIDYFRWHAATAVIESSRGNKIFATGHAEKALDAAEIKKSGFRFHQKLGLVGQKYQGLVNELRAIYA